LDGCGTIAMDYVVLNECPIAVSPFKDVNFKAVIFCYKVSQLQVFQVRYSPIFTVTEFCRGAASWGTINTEMSITV